MNISRHVVLLALSTLALAACGGDTQPAPAPVAPAAAPAPAVAAPAEAAPATDAAAAAPAATDAAAAPVDAATLTAILATADAADGTTDMVVAKCAGCKLGMDGKAENSLQAHGYTLHFCSPECKSLNEPKLDATIAALK